MNITHIESGRVIATDARTASNPWQRFRGLMLRRRLDAGEALIIEPCSSIHMMFMLFAIDAVFYSKEGQVTKVAQRVRPWIGLSFGGRGARGVIELPRGAAEGIRAGDKLKFGD